MITAFLKKRIQQIQQSNLYKNANIICCHIQKNLNDTFGFRHFERNEPCKRNDGNPKIQQNIKSKSANILKNTFAIAVTFYNGIIKIYILPTETANNINHHDKKQYIQNRLKTIIGKIHKAFFNIQSNRFNNCKNAKNKFQQNHNRTIIKSTSLS